MNSNPRSNRTVFLKASVTSDFNSQNPRVNGKEIGYNVQVKKGPETPKKEIFQNFTQNQPMAGREKYINSSRTITSNNYTLKVDQPQILDIDLAPQLLPQNINRSIGGMRHSDIIPRRESQKTDSNFNINSSNSLRNSFPLQTIAEKEEVSAASTSIPPSKALNSPLETGILVQHSFGNLHNQAQPQYATKSDFYQTINQQAFTESYSVNPNLNLLDLNKQKSQNGDSQNYHQGQKTLKRTLTVYKVTDWVTEVLFIRNKYKFLIKLAYNTLEIKE